MGKVSVRLSEFRENIPKNVQWLLLGAAFIIVLILFTLLVSGKKNAENQIQQSHGVSAELNITPDVINWADVLVGQKRQQKIELSATAPVKILSVTPEKDVNGFSAPTACTQMGMIDEKITCSITLKYEPSVANKVEQNVVSVVWHDADATDAMQKTSKIVVSLGATAPVVEKPKPEPEPELDYSASYDFESETEYEPEPDYYENDFVEEIESIAPPMPSFSQPVEPVRPPETCSDFAFPGYDNYGRQIGWIKPESGTYKFHPFSDTECNNPTGIYNPDNGIITDIDNPGKKIGTDAEHLGFSAILSGIMPELSNVPAIKTEYRAEQEEGPVYEGGGAARLGDDGPFGGLRPKPQEAAETFMGSGANTILPSRPYDRQFILRQYKPIPATIVSDVRADPESLKNNYLPVRATVDRNIYSDNGRNVIIPTGTLLMGYVTGPLPGPYTTVGRMNIKWYQFILPNGMEYNFSGGDGDTPFSGDAQGRSGIPGYGSSDYLEQFFMPMLTAIVPAAVNLIAPVSDAFVNQIDLDNNTVVQSGTVRSSELAKNEIITAWNQVAQKLLVDMMDNTVPPFTIAAGTRITVYSPVDLVASCGDGGDGRKCSLGYSETKRFDDWHQAQREAAEDLANDGSWIGQVRSFATQEYCEEKSDGTFTVKPECQKPGACGGYDYNTLLFYCQSRSYKAKNMARQEAVYANQQDTNNQQSIAYIQSQGEQAYNEQVLGLTYNDDGSIQNPFNEPEPEYEEPAEAVITCEDGSLPDANGCCTGEIYTDMGEMGFNCCPESGGDCFPPIL